MSNQFYDLTTTTLDDGTIRLEQRDYCGESYVIDLHPAQVGYIAAGLPAYEPEQVQAQWNLATEKIAILEQRIATLERRMLWMRNRFGECKKELPTDMYERCSEAAEFYAWLNASLDVVMEYCANIPDTPSSPPANPKEAPLSTTDDKSPPNTAGRAGAHPEQAPDVRTGELFTGN